MFDLSWLVFRLASLFTFSGLLIDIEVFILFIGFLFFHISLGVKNIINDYVHIKKVKLFLLILTRVSSIEAVRYALEVLL